MSGAPHRTSKSAWLYDGAAGLLCLVAFLTARAATRGLEWPCESDLYRDMGTAQSLLDGRLGEDPAYLGERWWYPPLVPALIGTASALSGTALHEAYTRFGPLFNLLAPAGLYALGARLFGRGAALASLTAFLFFGQHDLMSWLHATYSPWLWPCNVAQGFFYFALYALLASLETEKLWIAGIAGLLWGVTFLAHAAPGFLFGAIFGVLVIREAVVRRAERASLERLFRLALLTGGVALLVASPYVYDLALHYRGRIRNPAPLTWLASELSLESSAALARRLLSARGLLGLAGIAALCWPRLLPARTRSVLATWLVFAGAGLAYGYAAQRVKLPPFLPSWHFYFYLQAFESLSLGAGMLGALALLERGALRVFARKAPQRWIDAERWLDFGAAALLAAAVARWPSYAERADLTANRQASENYAKLPEVELYTWALGHLQPTDVVLAETSPGFFVAAAGRKVVWLNDIFSNPYVKLAPRAKDARTMLSDLVEGRYAEFSKLATRYDVRFVALHTDQRKRVSGAQPNVLKRRLRSKKSPGFDVYELVGARKVP
ncbi:MAG TPA: hypothetical protein VGK73_37345 [Polyangiaceae bacterium]